MDQLSTGPDGKRISEEAATSVDVADVERRIMLGERVEFSSYAEFMNDAMAEFADAFADCPATLKGVQQNVSQLVNEQFVDCLAETLNCQHRVDPTARWSNPLLQGTRFPREPQQEVTE